MFLSEDIDKGAEWFQSIRQGLDCSHVGIVVFTRENAENPWMHFEAGALARKLSVAPGADAAALARVLRRRPGARRGNPARRSGLAAPPMDQRLFPVLHRIEAGEIRGPLGAYQGTSTTRSDMGRMLSLLATVLPLQRQPKVDEHGFIIAEQPWTSFKRILDSATISVGTVIPDLASLLQRKTFDEPLHHCADQAWLARYEGARVTIDRLKRHEPVVRAACSEHEQGLFQLLLTDLDVYAMAIQALLLEPKRFPLGANGEREMDVGIRTCCEDRRLAIKSLTTRLLRSRDAPLTGEAVRFMAAETNEERKMIVHHLEGRIRAERERAYVAIARGDDLFVSEHDAIARLEPVHGLVEGRATRPPEPRGKAPDESDQRPLNLMRFRESSWDLDRIYYYLLVQYFGTTALRWDADAADGPRRPRKSAATMDHEWFCAARDVEMEVERYRARDKGGSLTPLTYALVALQALRPEEASRLPKVERLVASALMLVKKELGAKLSSEVAQPIATVLDQVADAMARERPNHAARASSRPGRTRARARSSRRPQTLSS